MININWYIWNSYNGYTNYLVNVIVKSQALKGIQILYLKKNIKHVEIVGIL